MLYLDFYYDGPKKKRLEKLSVSNENEIWSHGARAAVVFHLDSPPLSVTLGIHRRAPSGELAVDSVALASTSQVGSSRIL